MRPIPSGNLRARAFVIVLGTLAAPCACIPLKDVHKGKIAKVMSSAYGCTEGELTLEEVHESPLGPRDHQYRARGCGKEMLFTCVPGDDGQSRCLAGAAPAPVRTDAESEAKFRMHEAYGCSTVTVKHLEGKLYRATGCEKIVRHTCMPDAPGGAAIRCDVVMLEK